MRLWQEICKQLEDEGAGQNVTALRYMVTEGQGGYFQNVRAVYSFSGKAVVLLCGKQKITVEGEGLTIKKYCERDILIGGDIRVVRRQGEEE